MDLTFARHPDSSGDRAVYIADYSAANNGSTDATSGVAAALSAAKADGSYTVNTGKATDKWLITYSVDWNKWGIQFEGEGQILIAANGNYRKINTDGDRYRDIFGREYLSHFHKRIMAAQANKITFSGDSTTYGGGSISTTYYMSNAIPAMATKYGITGITAVNAGHNGETSENWLPYDITTNPNGLDRITSDLSGNPNLYVMRWCINDPFWGGMTADQSITRIREGLAICRAAKDISLQSLCIMSPNSTSDNVNARDSRYYDILELGLRQAARDYQCLYFGTNNLFRDSWNAFDWMDSPYGGGTEDRHVHPANCMAMYINSMLSDTLFPTMLRTNG